MAITTFDGFIASAKQSISHVKTASRTTIAAFPFTTINLAGNPGAGVLAGTSTTAGVVPTDATAGFPTINPFGVGNTGYLAQVDFACTVACRLRLYDLVFKAGAYAFNANVALSGQPSYASRVPGGTDFKDLVILVEIVTAMTGTLNVNITYTNQDGVAGRTAGVTATTGTGAVGRLYQWPLQAGDTGVQAITNVTGSVATAGTFNVLVARPLWQGRVGAANAGDVHDLTRTGLPIVYADSALLLTTAADSTSSGIPDVNYVIANG